MELAHAIIVKSYKEYKQGADERTKLWIRFTWVVAGYYPFAAHHSSKSVAKRIRSYLVHYSFYDIYNADVMRGPYKWADEEY